MESQSKTAAEPAADVLADVLEERSRQDAQWGGAAHDDEHTTSDWMNFIVKQTAFWFSGYGGSRERLVKIAALAVAAIEMLDRRPAPGSADRHPADEPDLPPLGHSVPSEPAESLAPPSFNQDGRRDPVSGDEVER